jgi:hypothetical protein
LESLGEYCNLIPESTTIQVKVKRKNFTIDVVFKNKAKISLFGGSSLHGWDEIIIPIEIKFNGELGFGCAMFWYPKTIREFVIQEIPNTMERIGTRTDYPMPSQLLVSFDEKEAQSVLISGRKGSSLAILQAIQEKKSPELKQSIPDYVLPQGFIISASAFERHLRLNSQISCGLKELENVAYEKIPGDLKDVCEK